MKKPADAAAKKPAEKKAAPLKAAVKAKKEVPKKVEVKQVKGKGYKGKKLNLKFTIDCTHPVEDGIMNASDFVSISYFKRSQFVFDALGAFTNAQQVRVLFPNRFDSRLTTPEFRGV